ncbi:MAG: hypothetical protein HZB38_09445 [Planctomycetes bacterium]|nr:hypothetical protein [Planctomycetota bacterium]
MAPAQRALVIILRVTGVILLTALFAVCLPTDWMAAIHRWAGLGEMPRAPIVEYLTRSISLLYAFNGGLAIVASFDVIRMRPLILFLAATGIVSGAGLLLIDLFAPMPRYWTVFEGPPLVILSAGVLWLTSRLPKKAAADRASPTDA